MNELLWFYSAEQLFVEEVAEMERTLGFPVKPVGSLADAIEQLRRTKVAAMLVSLPHAGLESEEILKQVFAVDPAVPIVLYEPLGDAATAVRLSRLGAHYIGEPVASHKLREVIRIASRPGQIPEPSEPVRHEYWRKLLIGGSQPMREVVETIALVGSRRSTVLITGETGTGKEIAARAIHEASPRAHLPMVTVNCAALPENLLEAELFGHTRGAFTGAVNARTGLFEQAHRSTILLDEIGEMPVQLQAKLLRVLQEREIHRIGSSETIRLDVRVIAASNCDLEAAVAQKRFRQDLFYRLNVVPLRMPALRERLSDIPMLVEHFIRKISELEGTPEKHASADALEFLMGYRWPGNVRQLEHAVESGMALSASRRLLHPSDFRLSREPLLSEIGLLSDLDVPESGIDLVELMGSIEKKLLERALLRSGGNKARAADLLNMKRTTLVSKFKALASCA